LLLERFDPYADCGPFDVLGGAEPVRLRKPFSVKTDRNRRGENFDDLTERKQRFESDPSKPDCEEPPFVREPKTAERPKFVLAKVAPIVPKDEAAIFDRGRSFRRPCIVRVLEQLGKDMSWVLDLSEEQPPGTAKFWVTLNLVPPTRCSGRNGIEKIGLGPHQASADWRWTRSL